MSSEKRKPREDGFPMPTDAQKESTPVEKAEDPWAKLGRAYAQDQTPPKKDPSNGKDASGQTSRKPIEELFGTEAGWYDSPKSPDEPLVFLEEQERTLELGKPVKEITAQGVNFDDNSVGAAVSEVKGNLIVNTLGNEQAKSPLIFQGQESDISGTFENSFEDFDIALDIGNDYNSEAFDEAFASSEVATIVGGLEEGVRKQLSETELEDICLMYDPEPRYLPTQYLEPRYLPTQYLEPRYLPTQYQTIIAPTKVVYGNPPEMFTPFFTPQPSGGYDYDNYDAQQIIDDAADAWVENFLHGPHSSF